MKGFAITRRKGFHMSFENGFTLSVQFGAGNYCENHYSWDYSCDRDWDSKTAEIAIWHEDHDDVHDWIDANYFIPDIGGEGPGGVCGWVTAEQVAEILYKLSTIESWDKFWEDYSKYLDDLYKDERKNEELVDEDGNEKEAY